MSRDYPLVNVDEINDALTYLFDHAPASLHLVIASRVGPNIPLPRLRARQQMIEIRASELRFSTAEAAEFFATHSEISLPAFSTISAPICVTE